MEESAQQPKTPASKPTNWYSGWRVFATAAATFVAAKLFGAVGALVAVLLFLWLQPKRGTLQALAAAAVVGVVVAGGLSVVLLHKTATPQAETPTSSYQSPPSNSTGAGALGSGEIAKQANPERWVPAPPNLKPFDGKLDGEK